MSLVIVDAAWHLFAVWYQGICSSHTDKMVERSLVIVEAARYAFKLWSGARVSAMTIPVDKTTNMSIVNTEAAWGYSPGHLQPLY